MSRPVKFNCPHCGTRISAEAEDAGRKASCPSCSGDIAVPDAPEGAPVASDTPPPLPQENFQRTEAAATPNTPEVPPPLPLPVQPQPQVGTMSKSPPVWTLRQRLLAALAGGLVFVLIKVIFVAASGLSGQPSPSAQTSLAYNKEYQAGAHEAASQFLDSIPCQHCGGSGTVLSRAQCRQCVGLGTIETPSHHAYLCQSCGGTGHAKEACGSCGGTGKYRSSY